MYVYFDAVLLLAGGQVQEQPCRDIFYHPDFTEFSKIAYKS